MLRLEIKGMVARLRRQRSKDGEIKQREDGQVDGGKRGSTKDCHRMVYIISVLEVGRVSGFQPAPNRVLGEASHRTLFHNLSWTALFK